ncbi:FAD binding domain-containing protein [Nocardiopsis sp. Huas11]|uniref:FAD-binding oxidoreductase n=1 Tax=Nocardiopsis sp. Huas11 TaxID=2183912 RepID=UPI000EB13A95|nr:FAD-binding protein [Nocardiopsis sp. Huas11]RKS08020.1 FAD binding domain-containing protein [Nocardiopsis sp. Huas11]
MPKTNPNTAAAGLGRRTQGPVLLPGHREHDLELAGFNLAVDARPALTVGATGPADVRAAVAHAADHALTVDVRATGHGVGPREGGLLVSTRRMTGVRVDPVARTARVEAGARWERVIALAAPFGLAPLNGSSPLVGAVGYTLGGGLPVLGRTFGWAADRVLGLDLVTADGLSRRVGPDQDPDLFWALRGGRRGFGVVTSMDVALVPVTGLYGGGLYFPGDRARRVLHAWRAWAEDVPESMNTSVALLRLPDADGVPEPLRGRLTVHVRVAHVGTARAGADLLRPLRALGPRLLDTADAIPTTAIASVHDDPTHPLPFDERSLMLRSFDEAAVDALIAAVGPDSGQEGIAMVEVRRLGGALDREPEHPRALDHRDTSHSLSALTPVAGAAPGGWAAAAGLLERMAPWGTGRAFLNFLGGPGGAALTHEAFTAGARARLAEVKARHDPSGLFPADFAPARTHAPTQTHAPSQRSRV